MYSQDGTTPKEWFNIVKSKSVMKKWGRKTFGGIFEIKPNFYKALTIVFVNHIWYKCYEGDFMKIAFVLYHLKTVSHKNRSWVTVILKKRVTLQFLSPRPARFPFFIVSFIFPRLSRRRIHRQNQTQCPLSRVECEFLSRSFQPAPAWSIPDFYPRFLCTMLRKHECF